MIKENPFILKLEINKNETEELIIKNSKLMKIQIILFFKNFEISNNKLKKKILQKIFLSLPKYLKNQLITEFKNIFPKNSKRSKFKSCEGLEKKIINKNKSDLLKKNYKNEKNNLMKKKITLISKKMQKYKENIYTNFSSHKSLKKKHCNIYLKNKNLKKKFSTPKNNFSIYSNQNSGRKINYKNFKRNYNKFNTTQINRYKIPLSFKIHNNLKKEKFEKKNEIFEIDNNILKKKILREIFDKLDPKNFGMINSKNVNFNSLTSFDLTNIQKFVIEIFKNPDLFVTFKDFCNLCL